MIQILPDLRFYVLIAQHQSVWLTKVTWALRRVCQFSARTKLEWTWQNITWLSLLWLVDTNNQQELSKFDQLEVLIFSHIQSLSCDFMSILNCSWFSVGVFYIICDLTSPRFSINFLTSSLIYFKGEQQSNIMTSYFILYSGQD